jgi:hypothetical protein
MVGRKLIWSFFVAALLVLVVGAVNATANSPMKSWNGTWIGDATIVGNCKNGTLLFVESGTGLVEHMGKTTWSSKYCMDPVTWTGSGNTVERAENGDEIHVKTSVVFTWTSASTGNWVSKETIVSGTGRFAAASGGSHSSGTFTLTSSTTAEWEGTTNGLISY